LTQNKLSTDEGRERATDDRSSHAQRHWIDVLLHRWPTALGIAVAALAVFDLQGGTELAALTMLMPVVYLGSAALDRRWSAWVVLLSGVAVLVVMPSSSEVVPSMIFLVAALVFLVVGVARGQLRKSGDLALQTVGVLAFGSTVLVALYVDPDLGGYLVALALIGHAGWDAHHYLRNRVVARSYAEWCAVVDLLAGAAVIFALFMR
jgi:MFS superfamily sulfate permease-like transporter